MLLMIVMGMGGIYRGLIHEATLLVDRVGADLWVVQGNTRGPFAEISRVPPTSRTACGGAGRARRGDFVSHTIQREHRRAGRCAWWCRGCLAGGQGQWIPLVAGRPLRQAHYEMIADQIAAALVWANGCDSGKDTYTRGRHHPRHGRLGGDGLAFFTVSDAQAIQFDLPGEAVRLERAARRARGKHRDLGRVQPLLLERAAGPARQHSRAGAAAGSAPCIVSAGAGRRCRPRRATRLSAWPRRHGIPRRRTGPAARRHGGQGRRQLGLFRVLLIVISTIIMALIIYTLTLDKTPRHRAAQAHRRAQPRHRRPDPPAGPADGRTRLWPRLRWSASRLFPRFPRLV